MSSGANRQSNAALRVLVCDAVVREGAGMRETRTGDTGGQVIYVVQQIKKVGCAVVYAAVCRGHVLSGVTFGDPT